MKKLFNYALLAAALLVGVNVNAQTFSIKQGDNESTATTLTNAVAAVTADGGPATITVNEDYTLSGDNNTGEVIKIDGGKDIILDLNGNEITMEDSNWKSHFEINNGKLRLASLKENSVGNLNLYGIYSNPSYPNSYDYPEIGKQATNHYGIKLTGSKDQLEEGEAYSKLVIDANVNYTLNHSGYAIQVAHNSYHAEGVVIEIKGTVTGGWSALTINGYVNQTKGNKAYIHLASTGKLVASAKLKVLTEDNEKAEVRKYYNEKKGITDEAKLQELVALYRTSDAGLYAAGMGSYLIEGTVEGGIGIYAKAGNLSLNNAVVKATASEYWPPIFFDDGYIGCGTAIIFDSNAGYSSEMSVVISGETNVSSEKGYAIEEIVTSGTGHMTGEDFVINSGTFKGGSEGCLSVTAELGEDVKVQGTITGGTYNENIVDLLSNVDGIITPSKDENGNDIYVVGTKPSGTVWKTTISNDTTDYVKLATGATQVLEDGGKAAYLVQEGTAKVTIPEGKTLEVGEIVMSKDAQIIVEKGAKLIVKGYKGIVANQASNIVLKSEEGAPAYFLLDPAVTSNKTPKATINFTSLGWSESSTAYQYQYFGAPFVGGVIESIKPIDFTGKTVFLSWNKTNWETVGTIGNGVSTMDYSKFNTPFGFYAMCAVTNRNDHVSYEIAGSLYGNTNPSIKVLNNYTALSNGFSGDMDGDAILAALGGVIESNVWVPYTDEQYELQWSARNEIRKLSEVHPMGTFMVKNDGNATNIELKYKDIVWEPATKTSTPSSAPKTNNFAMATVRVNGCGLNDIVTIAEDDQFSADFDNGYDAEKYENTNIRFYVNAEKEYDIFATDNLNNTFVGLMTTKAGKYTISFEDVTGNFALVDNKTNARIEMSEGNTYEFLAEAGEDAYRFQIVEAAKAPTNNEKVNAAVKATKALINDQIVISNGERFFNMLGTDVK